MNIPILIENFGVTLDWLGTAIQWLIGIGPIVGVGIILFTIILKTVVLPLDAFSKVKMRKNKRKILAIVSILLIMILIVGNLIYINSRK